LCLCDVQLFVDELEHRALASVAVPGRRPPMRARTRSSRALPWSVRKSESLSATFSTSLATLSNESTRYSFVCACTSYGTIRRCIPARRGRARAPRGTDLLIARLVRCLTPLDHVVDVDVLLVQLLQRLRELGPRQRSQRLHGRHDAYATTRRLPRLSARFLCEVNSLSHELKIPQNNQWPRFTMAN
jgi:hypothetical protein